MSKKRKDYSELTVSRKQIPGSGKAWLDRALQLIYAEGKPAAIGVAVAYSNGDIATMFVGEDTSAGKSLGEAIYQLSFRFDESQIEL